MISLNNIPQTSLDLIRLILINQIDIAPERVNIYDEKWVQPPNDDLFITLEFRNSRCLANRNTLITAGGTTVESQDVNMLENVTVGVFSKNRSAAQKKEEVLMAIGSSYAQQLMEKYAFKISRIGTIEDLSALEGSAMLKRYDVNLTVYAWYQKVITPGYIAPPYTIKVIANDPGNGEMIQNITQFTTQPT
jgi:hypothetical protein